MQDYTTYLAEFTKWCEYPEEGRQALLDGYAKLRATPEAARFFDSQVDLFERDLLFDYPATHAALERVSEACGVHVHTVRLLFALCLSRHTHELYEARGLSEDVFRMSMLDMKWKLIECKKHFDIWGAVAGLWFERFFRLTRFALGRLQFEPHFARHTYEKNGQIIHPGDVVINMHIPSCGPLTKEACMDSFRQAEQMFAPLFAGKPVPFMCSSWLLYPEHRNILPPTSRILGFMDFFDIVDSRTSEGGDLWRIFYTDDYSDLDRLPQETSVQRAYVAMLKRGTPAGSGTGYFFMKDGEIL